VVPASYDTGTTAYPVIYAMDGDAVFNPPGTRFDNFRQTLDAHATQAVMVGIGGTSRREQDYLLPGARSYHDFLTQELVPFIEAKYRADVKKRMLTGLSLSGSMAGVALMLEGASGSLTFSYFLSFEGSFDSQTDENNDLEQQMFDALAGKPLPATLMLTRCDNPQECNFGNVDDMYKRLLARAYPQFVVTETTYSTIHVATDIPSFADAVAKLLP
jgi:enterochelin esterase-like enzyme